MSIFSINDVINLMNKKNNIRNVSVIAHVDHGKSTLTDSLVAAAGIISLDNAGNQRIMDTRDDEQERCITIKSTGISLYFHLEPELLQKDTSIVKNISDGNEYLINLIDSPGHVDFSSEVTAALRITDGALVIVDCIEEVCVQTETVLRQSLSERIIPVLSINKLDRCFIELSLGGEEAYKGFLRIIEDVTFSSRFIMISRSAMNNVCFSAGLHGWAFILSEITSLYGSKINDNEKFKKKLWGENYYDNIKKKWHKKNPNGKYIRGFVKYCFDPLKVLITKIIEEKYAEVNILCEKFNVEEQFQKFRLKAKGKSLMKKLLQYLLPAHKSLLIMLIKHLPSPAISQAYRTEIIYEGPMDDKYSKSMRTCDPKGPLMMYISKMIPNSDKSRFIAFGRVFSGTITSGLKVRIMGSNYIKGSKKDLFLKSVQRIVLCMGRKLESTDYIPCGNTGALIGLDQFIIKTATITDQVNENAYPIKAMKFSVHPVVRRAVNVENPSDLPKLLEGLRKLSRSDPMVQCIREESGEYIIAGAGELHLEICIKDLKDDFLPGVSLVFSDPVVPYKETINSESNHICLAKSTNKHNRIYAKSLPIEELLLKDLDMDTIDVKNSTELSNFLVSKHKWDKNTTKNIWGFGPEPSFANMLLIGTKSIQYLDEIKDSCVSAFQDVTKEGILAHENMRGVIFTIVDLELHADSIHRGGGQIIPACKRVYTASFLYSSPRIMEPIFSVFISVPLKHLGAIYSVVSNRRGKVYEEVTKPGNPVCEIKVKLPVAESFGFSNELRSSTSGQAFSQCIFDHWALLKSDPMKDNSQANQIILSIRKRKGLKAELPNPNDFEDRL
ncbi:translation elongation factor eEF2 (nucleomorph) [Bigelowiella natans]|uniref:Translation elongation factor eEF2 n=1 Tax=Bigelowiella natans TaxID=227086 RepID=Q3LVZ0_BIGNA|nr:translation elongation factor eEF2 [Bigelowiella natans]ABA27376.1 translation elongation factor eEF2 [Bigelowiella natans]